MTSLNPAQATPPFRMSPPDARDSDCQLCRRHVPTIHTCFRQHTGAIVVRFTKKIEGDLCQDCVKRVFWRFTLHTLLIGWLGFLSFFIAPGFVIANIVNYVKSNKHFSHL